jgi:peroxiredoxin Q/BCP
VLTVLHGLDAVVLAVSPDSPATHRYFRQKYRLRITLLSDTDHAIMVRYGAVTESRVGDQALRHVVRSTFLIDPEGRIAEHWPQVRPDGHADLVGQRLAQLRPGGS